MTSKRQVTFPMQVMEKLRLKAGDTLQILETPDGILIKPHRFNLQNLAPLRDNIRVDLPPPDFDEIHHTHALEPDLRD